MDLLWPDSDGASAIQNLYAATHDLRRVVSAVPGLKLVVHDQKYRLRGESNVTFDVSRETHPIAV
jgi:DNA-binding SARP family transcriptional activator